MYDHCQNSVLEADLYVRRHRLPFSSFTKSQQRTVAGDNNSGIR